MVVVVAELPGVRVTAAAQGMLMAMASSSRQRMRNTGRVMGDFLTSVLYFGSKKRYVLSTEKQFY
jgi:hypothetical protein